MEGIENANAVKTLDDSGVYFIESRVVCGLMLCSEVDRSQRYNESKHMDKDDKMMMDKESMADKDSMMDKEMMMEKDDKMMTDEMDSMYSPLDTTTSMEIKSILGQTDYSPDENMKVVLKLDSYLSNLDELNLQHETIKGIANIVFHAQHDQLPGELAIYEIHDYLVGK